jgi:porin
MKTITRNLLFATLLLGAFAQTTQAQASTPDKEKASSSEKSIWARDKLTGDWGGLRTDLTKHGIDIDLRLSQYGQWVTSGGVDQSGQYGGTMDYRVNADGKKLLGSWDGLSLNMHARTRFGEDVNADAGDLVIQNTGLMMPAPADYHNTDVTGLVVSQYLPFFGGLANVTAGVLDVVDTLNGFFPNLGYGQEGFWNINSTVTALPWFGAVRGLSLYGAVAVTINEEFKMVESGFLVTGTENVSTSWSSLSDSFDDVWMAAFHRFYWKMDDKMGYFMVFGGYSTREQPSNEKHDFIVIPGEGIESTEEENPWDIAFYLYQDFWQAEGDSDRKANFMIGGTVGPENPQFAQYHLFANVETYGLMATRPHDRIGVSGWKNWLSDDFKDLVSVETDLRDLYGFELYYNFEVTPWSHLTADLQLVENEREDDSFAVIPGVRLVIDL